MNLHIVDCYPGLFMKVRSETVKTGVDTRRATEDTAGVLEQFVEESEGVRPIYASHKLGPLLDMPGSAGVVELS